MNYIRKIFREFNIASNLPESGKHILDNRFVVFINPSPLVFPTIQQLEVTGNIVNFKDAFGIQVQVNLGEIGIGFFFSKGDIGHEETKALNSKRTLRNLDTRK